MNLAVICPTRGRSANAVRLAKACAQTISPRFSSLVFVIDHDDPERDRYVEDLGRHAPWSHVVTIPAGGPRRMGPVLNAAAAMYCGDYDHLAFLGDDHLPRTPLWDERLCWSLNGNPGVAYGNDLFQGARLPTAVVLSSDLVRILGYMSPPPLVHLFIDDFWHELGQATQLRYVPDVVIEHLHPAAGKAAFDPLYAESGLNAELYRDDGWRWRQWHEQVWPDEVKRLRAALGG